MVLAAAVLLCTPFVEIVELILVVLEADIVVMVAAVDMVLEVLIVPVVEAATDESTFESIGNCGV